MTQTRIEPLAAAEPAARAYPSPVIAWWTVAVLFIAYLVSFVDRVLIGLLVEPIKADLNLTDTQFSLLQGLAFAVLYTVLGLPFGWLADRVSRKWLIAGGSAVWCAATVFCGLSQSFWQLLGARLGVGAGEAALPPSAVSLISDSFTPRQRPLAMSVYTAASSIGAGASLVLGGLVVALVASSPTYDMPFVGEISSWKAVFIYFGLGGFAVTIAALTMTEPKREKRTAATAEGASSLRTHMWTYRATFLPLLSAMTLYGVLAYGLLGWIPAFFIRTYGMAASEVGVQYGLVLLLFGGAGGLAGAWVAGRIPSRWGMPSLIVCAGAAALVAPLMSAGFASSTAFGALAWLAAGLLAYTVPSGLGIAAFQSAIPSEHRGMAAAFYYLLIGLFGMTLGPLFVALLSDNVFGGDQLRWSLVVLVAVCAPAAAVLFFMAARAIGRTPDQF